MHNNITAYALTQYTVQLVTCVNCSAGLACVSYMLRYRGDHSNKNIEKIKNIPVFLYFFFLCRQIELLTEFLIQDMTEGIRNALIRVYHCQSSIKLATICWAWHMVSL